MTTKTEPALRSDFENDPYNLPLTDEVIRHVRTFIPDWKGGTRIGDIPASYAFFITNVPMKSENEIDWAAVGKWLAPVCAEDEMNGMTCAQVFKKWETHGADFRVPAKYSPIPSTHARA